jgi:Zn-dependent M32 family carboxypeptidase
MSLADLKLQVSLLPFEQRRELERYLVSLETDEEFNHLISSRYWDQETYMPEKALEHRARQLSYLTGKAHGLLTSKRTLKLLERAETEMPENATQAANVRGLRRDIDRATKLPQKLVEEESQVTTLAKAALGGGAREVGFCDVRAASGESAHHRAEEGGFVWLRGRAV